MSLNLKDKNILKEILIIREKESNTTLKVLEYLVLIDERKLFTETNSTSLFTYCTDILNYSKGEAALRVNTVRLIRNNSGVKSKLTSKEISMSSANELQSFFRDERPSSSKRLEIIEKVVNKSKRQTKTILNELRIHNKRSLNLNLNERFLKKLDKVQELLGNCTELEALEALIDQKLRDAEFSKRTKKTRGSKNQRYVSRKTKELVFHKANHACEKCNSVVNLQIDHIKPIRLGGRGIPENLQILCFNCNQRKEIGASSVLLNLRELQPQPHEYESPPEVLSLSFELEKNLAYENRPNPNGDSRR